MAFKYKTKKRPSPMQLAVTSFAAGAAQGVAGASEQALKRETANKTSRDKASQKWLSMAKSFIDPKAKGEAYRVGMALIYGKMTEDEAFEIMSPFMSDESSFVKLEEPKEVERKTAKGVDDRLRYLDTGELVFTDIEVPEKEVERKTAKGVDNRLRYTDTGELVFTDIEVPEKEVERKTAKGVDNRLRYTDTGELVFTDIEAPEEEPEMEGLIYRNDDTGDEYIHYYPKGTEPPATLEDKPGYTRYRKLGTRGLGDPGRVRAWFAQYNRLNEDVFPGAEPYKLWDSTKKESLVFFSDKLEGAGELPSGATNKLREEMGLPPAEEYEWID